MSDKLTWQDVKESVTKEPFFWFWFVITLFSGLLWLVGDPAVGDQWNITIIILVPLIFFLHEYQVIKLKKIQQLLEERV